MPTSLHSVAPRHSSIIASTGKDIKKETSDIGGKNPPAVTIRQKRSGAAEYYLKQSFGNNLDEALNNAQGDLAVATTEFYKSVGSNLGENPDRMQKIAKRAQDYNGKIAGHHVQVIAEGFNDTMDISKDMSNQGKNLRAVDDGRQQQELIARVEQTHVDSSTAQTTKVPGALCLPPHNDKLSVSDFKARQQAIAGKLGNGIIKVLNPGSQQACLQTPKIPQYNLNLELEVVQLRNKSGENAQAGGPLLPAPRGSSFSDTDSVARTSNLPYPNIPTPDYSRTHSLASSPNVDLVDSVGFKYQGNAESVKNVQNGNSGRSAQPRDSVQPRASVDSGKTVDDANTLATKHTHRMSDNTIMGLVGLICLGASGITTAIGLIARGDSNSSETGTSELDDVPADLQDAVDELTDNAAKAEQISSAASDLATQSGDAAQKLANVTDFLTEEGDQISSDIAEKVYDSALASAEAAAYADPDNMEMVVDEDIRKAADTLAAQCDTAAQQLADVADYLTEKIDQISSDFAQGVYETVLESAEAAAFTDPNNQQMVVDDNGNLVPNGSLTDAAIADCEAKADAASQQAKEMMNNAISKNVDQMNAKIEDINQFSATLEEISSGASVPTGSLTDEAMAECKAEAEAAAQRAEDMANTAISKNVDQMNAKIEDINQFSATLSDISSTASQVSQSQLAIADKLSDVEQTVISYTSEQNNLNQSGISRPAFIATEAVGAVVGTIGAAILIKLGFNIHHNKQAARFSAEQLAGKQSGSSSFFVEAPENTGTTQPLTGAEDNSVVNQGLNLTNNVADGENQRSSQSSVTESSVDGDAVVTELNNLVNDVTARKNRAAEPVTTRSQVTDFNDDL
ncbi:TPA: Tir intimin-binding domain-containing protein [Citrobacter werkmanii]